MDSRTAEKLLDINQEFYQTLGKEFSETRMKLQPGVMKIIDHLPDDITALDIGCGNGFVAVNLLEMGKTGSYLGVDFSQSLINEAIQLWYRSTKSIERSSGNPLTCDFKLVDLTGDILGIFDDPLRYNEIFAFAVFHHIPGISRRQKLISSIHDLMTDSGRLYISVWQFLKSPKLISRIQDWKLVGISPSDVDEDDYLLDWRHGGYAYRYVHHFSEAELHQLANENGFNVVDQFYSDGSSGDLALYQIWRKSPPSG